jgi:ATP phosphoribosyltransferase regulatory subunit
VCAPHLDDAALRDKVAQLRAAGEAVVVDLLGDRALRKELQCDRELVLRDGVWQVVSL